MKQLSRSYGRRFALLITTFALFVMLSGEARAAGVPGDYPPAYQALLAQQASQAGNAEFDFRLGRAAYEVGDYETAIFAFERVLIAQPDSDRTRLELARTFYAIGDLETSRQYFNAVLSRETPLTVRQNIEAFLSRIDQAQKHHLFGGMLSLGVTSDDNVFASPAADAIRTLLGTVTLNGATASPRSDLIGQATLLLNHAWRFDGKPFFWQTSLQSHNAIYQDESSLDLNLLGLSSGPVWNRNQLQCALRGNVNYLELDHRRYLSSVGGEGELTWAPDPRRSFGLLLRLARIDYAEAARDALQSGLELKPALLWQNCRISGNLGLEFNAARDDQQSYLREAIGLRIERPLSWQFIGNLGYRFQNSTYRQAAALFGVKRHDRVHEVTAGLTRPFWQTSQGAQLLGQLNYTYSSSDSNIDLYQFDKNVTTLSLSWLF